MFRVSANGRALIEHFEGLFLHAYDDGGGTLTIGYGHTSAAGLPHVYRGMTITKEQADEILSSDLHGVEIDVNRLVKVAINQNQFDALASFQFNLGELARSNVLRAVNSRQFDDVPGDMMLWDHMHIRGRLVESLGLERRRHAEGVLFATPMDDVKET